MALLYDFYETPQPNGRNKRKRLHARAVTHMTLPTKSLAYLINEFSSLSTADVKAVLHILSEVIVEELSKSRRIHLDGLGYFYLTLTCPPISSPNEIRAESVKVKSLAFRPEQDLKKRIRSLSVERVREKNHSVGYSDIEIDGLLTGHFMDKDYITYDQFRKLCGMTRPTASRRLKKLVDADKLRRSGSNRSLFYEPVPGNYRK